MALQIYTPFRADEWTYQGGAALGQGLANGINSLGASIGEMMGRRRENRDMAEMLRAALSSKDQTNAMPFGDDAVPNGSKSTDRSDPEAEALGKASKLTTATRSVLEHGFGYSKDQLNTMSLPQLKGALMQRSYEAQQQTAQAENAYKLAQAMELKQQAQLNTMKIAQAAEELDNYRKEPEFLKEWNRLSKSGPNGPVWDTQIMQEAAANTGFRLRPDYIAKMQASLSKGGRTQADPEIVKVFNAYQDALAAGDTEQAAFYKAHLDRMNVLPAQFSMETGPDGRTIINYGNKNPEPGTPTTAFKTQAQNQLSAFDNVAPLIADIRNQLRPKDVGVRGSVGEWLDEIAPQLGIKFNEDPKRIDNRTKIKLYREAMLKLATSDQRIDKYDRASIEKMLGGTEWLESYPSFIQKINTVNDFIKGKARSLADRADEPLPLWAMSPDEIKHALQKGDPRIKDVNQATELIKRYHPDFLPK